MIKEYLMDKLNDLQKSIAWEHAKLQHDLARLGVLADRNRDEARELTEIVRDKIRLQNSPELVRAFQ